MADDVSAEKSPQISEPGQPDQPRSAVSMWRRLMAFLAADRLRAAIVVGATVAAVGGVLVAWVLLRSPPSAAPTVTIEAALEALDRGAYSEARRLAQQLRDEGRVRPYRLGAVSFVLGVAAAREADNTWASDKRRYYLLAARHLEHARDRGFPPDRDAEGIYHLGRCLFLSGRVAASRPVLREALAVNPERRGEIRFLLASACLHDAHPKLAEALGHNHSYLAEPKLSTADRNLGLVQQAQILLQMGQIDRCEATLSQVPDSAENRADAMVVRAQALMARARHFKQEGPKGRTKSQQAYEAAIKILRQVPGRDTLETDATRKSTYLIGLCLLELEDYRAALAQFVRTRTLFADADEGQAANLQEAELHRQFGRDNEALAAYRRALNPILDPQEFNNPWLPLENLQARILAAYRHYVESRKFDECLRLVDMLVPVFPVVRVTELRAELHRAWGRDLLSQAEREPGQKTELLAAKGREQLRRAARTFAELAQLRAATRHYTEDLWESAINYFEGHDYRSAAKMLAEYLNAEPRRRQSQALTCLGEALLALGQFDDALSALRECIDLYPRDPITFRARLIAADASIEKNDLAEAESFLRENLGGEWLTPASREWRDSLFALGHLLHASNRFDEAIARLEEAVARYPDAPQAIEARYLIADAYRRKGEAAQDRLSKDLVEAGRAARAKKVRECFEAALAKYKETQDSLNRRQETAELSAAEKAMLRNCYFCVGDMLFALKQYDAAVRAYSLAASRYHNCPEVLGAYLQIARAHARAQRPAEARGALDQAKAALARLKPDAPFSETTNYTRQEWADLLAQLTAP